MPSRPVANNPGSVRTSSSFHRNSTGLAHTVETTHRLAPAVLRRAPIQNLSYEDAMVQMWIKSCGMEELLGSISTYRRMLTIMALHGGKDGTDYHYYRLMLRMCERELDDRKVAALKEEMA